MNFESAKLSKSLVAAPRNQAVLVNEVIGAFESDTAAVFQKTAPRNEHIVLYVLAAMLALAVLLSAVVKLDRVVTSTQGLIATTAGFAYVSPLAPGVIRQVNVKQGQIVKKGQPLATLDPTFTRADLVQLQSHLGSDEAAVAREEAELAGRPYEYSNSDPYQVIQGGLWQKRQAQYRADLANYDAQIRSAGAQLAQARSDVKQYEQRKQLAADAESVYQPLLEKGYVSKLQVMQSMDTRTEMSRLLGVAQAQVSQYNQQVAAGKAQRDSYIHKWQSDLATQLVSDRHDLEITRDSLDKAQKLQDLTSLDSPVDAVVLKVGKVSQGSVAPGGGQDAMSPGVDPLFTLVPLDVPVEADIDVESKDVSFIRVGDPVTMKLDAYPYIRHGTASGVVKTISEGSFTVNDNNVPVPPYFKIRVSITRYHMRNVPSDFRAIPGMTLVADIMVGRRTILSYIVEGALRTGSEAMREP
jgi:HlyD family type I secretion membrane fusion protein